MSNDLDCKIYLSPPAIIDRAVLAPRLATAVNGTVSGTAFAPVVTVPAGEFEVRANDDFNAVRSDEHPDGFLYYRTVVEFFAVSGTAFEDRVLLIGRALEWMWSNGW